MSQSLALRSSLMSTTPSVRIIFVNCPALWYRYVGLNPYMTQARLARLYGSDPTLFEKLLHHKLSDTAVQTQVQYLDTAAERAPYRVHIEDGLFLVYNDFDCVSSPSCNKSRQRLLFDTGKLFSNCSGPGYGIHVFRDACSEECDFDDANNTARAEDELYAYSHKVGHVSRLECIHCCACWCEATFVFWFYSEGYFMYALRVRVICFVAQVPPFQLSRRTES